MPILPFEKHRLDLPPHRICAPRSLRPRYSYIDMASSSNSPCAACKFLRRKCTAECVFSPYFPPDQPHKFANVHKIFGASNITKLLNELPPHQREDAVNSLAYEADARVKDPVYGCVGAISVLQRHVAQLQQELAIAHSDLARYTGAGLIASPSMQQQPGPSSSLGIGMGLTISPSAVRERMYTARDQIPTRDQQLISRDLQLLELQRETQLTREQILDQLARSSGGSYDTGLATFGMTGGMGPYPSRTGSEGRSGGGPGSMGHLSPP